MFSITNHDHNASGREKMTRKARQKKKSQSPYVKYGKTPFRYSSEGCKHSRHVFQPVAASKDAEGWSGYVCAACNIIISKDSRDRMSGAA